MKKLNLKHLSIEITEREITVIDEFMTVSFGSSSSAIEYCQNIVASGNGEWWVDEYRHAIEFLESA